MINTTANSFVTPLKGRPNRFPTLPLVVFTLAAMLAVYLASARAQHRRWLFATCAGVFSLCVLTACGGSGGNGGGVTGTPAGSYTVTITGTAGSDIHSVTVALTVQ